jgi:hypothetical protein
MMQVIEQTQEEKLKMYMKFSKVELAKMLIECNRILEAQMQVKDIVVKAEVIGQYCACSQSQCYLMNGSYICATCNRPISR